MSRPISWYRLYRGKVWHVGWAADAAACGAEPGAWAESVGERAPVNARICGDCVSTVRHLYGLVLAAEAGDPRKPFDPWAHGEALIAAEDGASDAEAPAATPEPATVDLVGALRGAIEAARDRRLAAVPDVGVDEWPCGSCGHPNSDHDCVDGTCTVADDAFDAAAGEPLGPCECRGLTRAG